MSFEGTARSVFTEAPVLIKEGPGFIEEFVISCGFTTDTLYLYDALTATGTPIFKAEMSSYANGKSTVIPLHVHAHFETGLYVDFTGGLNQISQVNITYR